MKKGLSVSANEYGLVVIGIGASIFYYVTERTLDKSGEAITIVLTISVILLFSVFTQFLINKINRAQAITKESELKYRLLAENITDIVWTLDGKLQFTYLSPSLETVLGLHVQELLGQKVDALLQGEAHAKFMALVGDGKNSPGKEKPSVFTLEYRHVGNSGPVWLEARISPLYDRKGSLESIHCTSRDISKRKQAEEALKDANENLEMKVSERTEALQLSNEQLKREITSRKMAEIKLLESEIKYRTIFENSGTAMVIVNNGLKIALANSVFCRFAGYSQEEIENHRSIGEFLNKNAITKIQNGFGGDDEKSAPVSYECIFTDKTGKDKDIFLTFAQITKTDNAVLSLSDISELKEAERQIYHQAFHDALTGLPNRALFLEYLTMAIKRARRRSEYLFAVLYLDIDRFKIVNDSLGHFMGDKLLISFASRIKQGLRELDTFARLGGDEFAILLEDIGDENYATLIAERLQSALRKPFLIEGHEIFAPASFGIVLKSGEDGDDPESIVRDADAAMYFAKETGRAQFKIFDKTLHEKAITLLRMETDLRKAVEREEFEIHYQPIIDMTTHEVHGFEALVRWNHPTLGFIVPESFISIAEETGLIIPIGKWVFQKACQELRTWQDESDEPLKIFMSINLSGKQFSHPNLIKDIRNVLENTGLDPAMIKLEITETVLMEDAESAIEMLNRLKALGLQIVMDDFGTGYSSLNYLQRFPIDTIKVDRSFIARMMEPPEENKNIVEAIVTLAHRLKLVVIAEGVETPGQLAQLAEMKCQFAQGYYFSRPLVQGEARALLANSQPGPPHDTLQTSIGGHSPQGKTDL